MKHQTKKYVTFASIVVFILLLCYQFSARISYEKDLQTFQNFKKSAKILRGLQKLHGSTEENKKSIKRIKSIFKPTKEYIKKRVYTMVFENLGNTDLDRLGKILLNSKLIIREIDIEKVGERAYAYIEVQI